MKELDEKKQMEMNLADTIIDRPHGFSVGGHHFYLYPVPLGKMYLLSRLIDELDLNTETIKLNPYIETLRIATQCKELCSRILTYHTIHTKAKIFDNEFVEKRTKWFVDNLSIEDLATLMVMVLTSDKTEIFMKFLQIDKEQERMKRVMDVKDNKCTFNFGGMSVYGTLIDAACERYHWTFDYVMWEISYTNLKLMLADAQKQVYLSEEERKRVKGVSSDRNRIKASDKEMAWAAIRSEKWD